jgi:hypothetical protein
MLGSAYRGPARMEEREGICFLLSASCFVNVHPVILFIEVDFLAAAARSLQFFQYL